MRKKLFVPLMATYFIIALCFVGMLAYMAHFEYVRTTDSRQKAPMYEVTEYQTAEVLDEDTPGGMYMEYTFKLPPRIQTETWLFFFESHQYIRVLIDNELVFTMDNGNNKIGRSAGHMWATIPLEPTDAGRIVRVQLIPVYEGVLSSNLAFYLGQQIDMYAVQIRHDIAAAILSMVVMTLGFVYLIVALRTRLRGGVGVDKLYLGTFCIQVGFWRITDLASAPLFFPTNTRVLSYICLVSLYLLPISMLRFLRDKIHVKEGNLLNVMAIIGTVMNLIFFVLQIFNIKDLREVLPVFHVYVMACQVTVIYACVKDIIKEQNAARKYLSAVVMIFIAACVIADLYIFYRARATSMVFTMTSVLVYVAASGLLAAYQVNRLASLDEATGLHNKNRCIEVLGSNRSLDEEDAVIMFDLNGLKMTNDTKGHEVGDAMISAFSTAIKNLMPQKAFLGRFGGDEFIAIVYRTDEKEIETILRNIQSRIEFVNAADPVLQISYSEGHVFSSEFPTYNYFDLMEEADKRMYKNKRHWHEQQSDSSKEE